MPSRTSRPVQPVIHELSAESAPDVACHTRRVYASTACLPATDSLPSRIAAYRAAGITAVELGAGVRVETADLDLLPSSADHFLVHNYFPPPREPFVLNLASANTGIRKRSLDMVVQGLELSARLGAPFYSVHAGFVCDPIGFGGGRFQFPPPQSPEDTGRAMDRFVSALGVALDRARSLGLMLLVENNVCWHEHAGKLLLQTADEFAQLFDRLPSPDLGILLDTGHLNVSAQTLGFDRMAFVERLASRIQAFHLHDNDGSADSHSPIGSGSWVLYIVRLATFRHIPAVVEARFGSAITLGNHLEWLERELSHA